MKCISLCIFAAILALSSSFTTEGWPNDSLSWMFIRSPSNMVFELTTCSTHYHKTQLSVCKWRWMNFFFAFKKFLCLTLGEMLNFVTQCSRLDWEDGRVNDLATAKVRQLYCVADQHFLYFSNDPYSLSVLGNFLPGDSIILLGTNYIKLPIIYYR